MLGRGGRGRDGSGSRLGGWQGAPHRCRRRHGDGGPAAAGSGCPDGRPASPPPPGEFKDQPPLPPCWSLGSPASLGRGRWGQGGLLPGLGKASHASQRAEVGPGELRESGPSPWLHGAREGGRRGERTLKHRGQVSGVYLGTVTSPYPPFFPSRLARSQVTGRSVWPQAGGMQAPSSRCCTSFLFLEKEGPP